MLKIKPTTSNSWSVEGGYGEQPFVFPTKAQAINFFLAWAEQHQPCEVQIFNERGDLERVLKYPDGNHRRASGTDRRQRQVAISFPDRRQQDRRAYA